MLMWFERMCAKSLRSIWRQETRTRSMSCRPPCRSLDKILKRIAEIEEAKIDLKYSKNRSLTLIGVRVGAAFLIVFVISIILRGLNFRIIDQADLIVNDIINLIIGI